MRPVLAAPFADARIHSLVTGTPLRIWTTLLVNIAANFQMIQFKYSFRVVLKHQMIAVAPIPMLVIMIRMRLLTTEAATFFVSIAKRVRYGMMVFKAAS